MEDKPKITDEMRRQAEARERERQGQWRELKTGMRFRPSLCEGGYGHRWSSWRCSFHGQFPHLHIEFMDEEGEGFLRPVVLSQQGVYRVAQALERIVHDMTGIEEALMQHPTVLALPEQATPEELADIETCIAANKLTTPWWC